MVKALLPGLVALHHQSVGNLLYRPTAIYEDQAEQEVSGVAVLAAVVMRRR